MNNRRQVLLEAARAKGFEFHVRGPDPNLWQPYLVDPGLLIISRFPIVEHQFYEFQQAPVQEEVLCMKGALYAKIKLPSGKFMHLVTCHTQASYFDAGLDVLTATYLCRYKQI
jgi:hypothetical protein